MLISELQLKKGHNNIDLIRFFAAFLVFFEHSFGIFTGEPLKFDIFREIFRTSAGAFGVNVFFILSGFLICRSYENSKNIFIYLVNRFFRILPALITVTFVSVLVLGLFFSKMDFYQFIFHKTTRQFYQNILIFRSYYYLPEVFLNNPLNSTINGSIWTIPYEFTCYLILPIIASIPYLKSKFGLLFLLIFCFFAFIFFQDEIYKIVIPIIGVTFSSLTIPFLYFLSGVCFYKFINYLPYNYKGFLICLVLLVILKTDFIPRISLVFFLPYLVFFFAFSSKIKLNNFGKFGDFSYGFYLYAFPVQQAISSLFYKDFHFSLLFLLAFSITLMCSIFSWYLVEKPALNLKKKIIKFL